MKLKTPRVSMKNQPWQQIIKISYDLNDIQLRAIWVWICDGIGFDPNVNEHRIVYIKNFLLG